MDNSRKIRISTLLILAVVSMALTACSVYVLSIPYDVIERVVVVDGTLYAVAGQKCVVGNDACPPERQALYASSDQGLTWQETSDTPPDVSTEATGCVPHTRIVCAATTPGLCFRINGAEQIERSTDGGATWHVVWEMPSGRQGYQARTMGRLPPDAQPYDLALMEADNELRLIAAMGNQGVLIGAPDGSWRRVAVGLAVPASYQATTLAATFDSLQPELFVAVLTAALLLPLLCLVGWDTIFSRRAHSTDQSLFSLGCLPPIVLLGAGLLMPWIILFVGRVSSTEIGVSLFVVMPLLGAVLAWKSISTTVLHHRAAWSAALACLYHPILLFAAVMLPFLLWAMGMIPVYWLARGFAVLLGLAAVLWALVNETRLARRVGQPPPTIDAE